MRMYCPKLRNPFRFENRTLPWLAWGNVVLAAFLFSGVISVAFVMAPHIWALGARAPFSPARLDQVWNVVKMRKLILEEDNGNRTFLRDSAELMNAVAFLGGCLCAMFLLNALYVYNAYRALKAAQKTDSDVKS